MPYEEGVLAGDARLAGVLANLVDELAKMRTVRQWRHGPDMGPTGDTTCPVTDQATADERIV